MILGEGPGGMHALKSLRGPVPPKMALSGTAFYLSEVLTKDSRAAP